MLLTVYTLHVNSGMDIANCRGQSYDNASNMSGRYNGVQAIVKRECKYAVFVPCINHSLNLVGDQAAESCADYTSLFDFVNDYMDYGYSWVNISLAAAKG